MKTAEQIINEVLERVGRDQPIQMRWRERFCYHYSVYRRAGIGRCRASWGAAKLAWRNAGRYYYL